MSTSVFAQTDSPAPKPKSVHKTSAHAASSDIQELKDAIAAQQQQIQQLQQQVQSRDSAIQQLQQQVGQAQSTALSAQQAAAAEAGKQSPESSAELTALQHDVTDLKTVSATQSTSCRRRRSAFPAWKARWQFTTRESPLPRAASWRQKPCGVSALRAPTSTLS